MIRAIVHLLSEQPVTADLFDMPKAGDSLLLCTNMRTLDGKRPVFLDDVTSTFVLPYLHIRFIEIPGERAAAAEEGRPGATAAEPEAADADLEIDEDFLRRIREA